MMGQRPSVRGCRLGTQREVLRGPSLMIIPPSALQKRCSRTCTRVQASSEQKGVLFRALHMLWERPTTLATRAMHTTSTDPLMVRAARGEVVERPPCWYAALPTCMVFDPPHPRRMMRQAGRYQQVLHQHAHHARSYNHRHRHIVTLQSSTRHFVSALRPLISLSKSPCNRTSRLSQTVLSSSGEALPGHP